MSNSSWLLPSFQKMTTTCVKLHGFRVLYVLRSFAEEKGKGGGLSEMCLSTVG